MLVNSIISLVSTVVMLAIFLWVLLKSPKSQVSRVFLLSLLCLILVQIGFLLISSFESFAQVNWGYHLIALGLSFSPLIWIWFSLIFARESYQITLRRWKYLLFAAFALGGIFLFLLISRNLVFLDKDIFGTINFLFLKESNVENNLLLVFLLLSSILVLINFESTFRFSKGNLRRQLLVPMLLLILFPFLVIFSASYAMLFAKIGVLPFLLVGVLSIFMSVSVGKYLVKTDLSTSTVYIGRRIAYSSVALILIGVYLLFIGVVTKIVQLIGGSLNIFYSILAAFLVIVTFSVLVVFGSVKQRIKNFVDKTFYRGKFDYQKEWSELSENISAILDLDELLFRASDSVSQSLEVKDIYLFLAQTDGTYTLYYPKGVSAEAEIRKGDELLDWLWLYAKPIKTEDLKEKCNSLNSPFMQGAYLDSIRTKVCVPLVTKRKLVGFLFLGEKSNKKPFTNEELSLLEAVAHQLAIAILNAKMSEELLVSKEMESFHKLSSFVVHDLKNSISMLSMLLQNAKDNMNDPDFQKTALLTISDAVDGMKGLVSKLSSPPKGIQLDLAPRDLGQVVQDVLKEINPNSFPKIKFNLKLGQTPLIRIDRTQISKVMQNLIINAIESMPQEGNIDIYLRRDNSFLCLKVSDSGAGMSVEFIRDKLFKPFQTTKKKGLGIGLYQCKEIIEAHRGEIKVDSEKGKGTTFEVKLPID